MINTVTGPQPTGGQTANTQQAASLSAQEEAALTQGVGTVAAGFLLLLHGEQKKMLNETANEINK